MWPPDRRYGEVDVIPSAGASSAEQPYTDRAWAHASDRFARGELSYFGVTASCGASIDAAADELGERYAVAFGFDLGGEEGEHAHRLFLHITDDLLGPSVPRALQEKFVATAAGLARDGRAATGFVTHDHVGGDESPLELGTGRSPDVALRECDHVLRGYYWTNILSKHHVETLGGLARVQQDAPCSAVDVLDEQAPLVLLRLTDDINRFSDEELAALRAYLRPVLPPLTGYDQYYEGPPLRLVETGAPNAQRELADTATPRGIVFYGALPNLGQLLPDDDEASQAVAAVPDVEVERTPAFDEELPDVYVTVYLERAPTAQERAEFERVIAAWYDMGARAGFGDAFRNGSNVDYTEDEGQPIAQFWADIGESGEPALDALLRAIRGLAEIDGLPARRVLFGTWLGN